MEREKRGRPAMQQQDRHPPDPLEPHELDPAAIDGDDLMTP